jgi:hypothetical protein
MTSHHGRDHVIDKPENFSVRLCGCGVAHLNFGPTTVNVTPEVALAITETLNNVAIELKSRANVQERRLQLVETRQST